MARFRRPSLAERIAIAALTVYAAAVIALDTARPFLLARPDSGAGWPRRWYPIADLGFEADNDGRITSVDPGGSAWQAGLRAGQHQVIAIGSYKVVPSFLRAAPAGRPGGGFPRWSGV